MATKVEALNVPATGKARKKISIVPYLFIAPHLLFFCGILRLALSLWDLYQPIPVRFFAPGTQTVCWAKELCRPV